MNEEKLEYLGIKKFHEAGILGQGITVASIENGITTHSKKTMDVLHQILPEAKIITNIKYWKDDIPQFDGYNCSQIRAFSENAERIAKQKEMYDRNVFMACSIGNEWTDDYNKLAKYDEWVSVGACVLNKDKSVSLEYYSSISKYLDFCSLTNWKTEYGTFTGTSCACPVLMEMAMLIKCLYKVKFNTIISNKKLYNIIRSNCIDVKEKGFDDKSGYGLFVLPEPSSLEEDSMQIVLKIGDKKALVNSKTVELDVAPKIENGRTLVPIRFISEALGCDVEWDSLERKILINK